MINAAAVLQMQLAHSLGLDCYADIVRGDPNSPDFQRVFNGYYRIRRNKEWRRDYYDLFIRARDNRFTFEQIITDMFRRTGNVEASFSSKMLATIDTSKPIWDRYVLQNLGVKLTGKTPEEKMKNAVKLYIQIEEWYAEYLTTPEAHDNIEVFNRLLPEYTWVSDTKKIDCLLWSKRA